MEVKSITTNDGSRFDSFPDKTARAALTGVLNLKTMHCGILGDSITYGTGASSTSKSYAGLLAGEFAALTNYGVEGSCIAQMWSNPMVSRYSSMSDDLDLVIVFGGVNDFYAGVPIGEADSTSNTEFNGALNTIMSGLMSKYAGKEIVFVTPTQCDNGTLATTAANSAGNTMQDYVDAIKERCNHYSIPCLDLHSLSGMGVAVSGAQHTAFSHDGIHPNDAGHQRIYRRIVGFLRGLV